MKCLLMLGAAVIGGVVFPRGAFIGVPRDEIKNLAKAVMFFGAMAVAGIMML